MRELTENEVKEVSGGYLLTPPFVIEGTGGGGIDLNAYTTTFSISPYNDSVFRNFS